MRFASILLRRFVSCSVVCCGLLLPSWASGDELLRWKFTAGEKLDYEMAQDMNMNMDAGPSGKLATTANQTMNMTWNVKSVDDKGAASIEQKIDRIRMKMTAPGGQGFEYDTESESAATGVAAMIAPTMKAMTAGNFTFTLSPRGEISDAILSEDLAVAIKSGPGGGKGAADQFKSMVSQIAFTLPENPPKPGEEWTMKINVVNPTGGNQPVETTYNFTYDGTRDADGTTYAVIKPNIKLQLPKNPMMEMKTKGQKTDGEVLIDLKAGQLHSMSINQNIMVDIVAGGQTLPGTIDQKIDVTVTPAKEKSEKKVEKKTPLKVLVPAN